MVKIRKTTKSLMRECVDNAEDRMKDYLVYVISNLVKNKYNGKVLFNEGNMVYDMIEIKSLFIDNRGTIWGEYKIANNIDTDLTTTELKKAKYELVRNIALLFDNPSCIKPYYMWVAKNGEDKVEDHSEGIFEDEKQAYENMRDAAFDKMAYDTKYDEEYMNTDEYEEGAIDYSLSFSRNKIVAKCYSGVVTYEIFKVN